MAAFTPLTSSEANFVSRSHGLGECVGIRPIAAGSVNTNFFLTTERGEVFLRIYEEQEEDGVAYEWALLEHMTCEGVPMPRRLGKVAPGEVRASGKPTAVFSLARGVTICADTFDSTRARSLGGVLARIHVAGQRFGWKRPSRFQATQLRGRLDRAAAHGMPELEQPIAQLREELEHEVCSESLPRGVIHGDLFRDNAFFLGSEVSAVIDWESASDGVFLFDLAVVFLAWCYRDSFDWGLGRALIASYHEVRPLIEAEWNELMAVLRSVAARFAITRITDFYLRSEGVGERVMKDYRRFMTRLDVLAAMDSMSLRDVLSP